MKPKNSTYIVSSFNLGGLQLGLGEKKLTPWRRDWLQSRPRC